MKPYKLLKSVAASFQILRDTLRNVPTYQHYNTKAVLRCHTVQEQMHITPGSKVGVANRVLHRLPSRCFTHPALPTMVRVYYGL